METLTVKNGFYGADGEIALVIDHNSFLIQSPNIGEGEGYLNMDIEDLDDFSFKFLGEQSSYALILEFSDTLAMIYAEMCRKQLERLNVDTSVCPYNGIYIDSISEIKEDLDESKFYELVNKTSYPCKVYDDYASAYVDAQDFYEALRDLDSASLNSADVNYI